MARFFYFLEFTGRSIINFYSNLFSNTKLFFQGLLFFFTSPFYSKRFGDEIINIGLSSIPIVSMTALFSGSVLALQSYVGFSRMDATNSIPIVVALSMIRELGPVLTGLMLSGRIASNIASEIGSMKITDQLDAMHIIGVEKIQYLLRPKLIAMILCMPLLTLIADIFGLYGGYLISITKLNYNPITYQKMTFDFLTFDDISSGIIKSSCFGLIIILVGYFSGLSSVKNTYGVGISTRNAVVYSTGLILIANYLLTYILF
jgi:phospholipid/cholesterol/gamma-HCH transport system permease protein